MSGELLRFRWARPGGPWHEAACTLRYEELRRPLGMPRGSERYEAEEDALHLVAVAGGSVVASVTFHPDGAGGGRLLQMAVGAAQQRTGVGSALVQELERRLAERDIRSVTLHARDTAVGFYERLGYEGFGAPYVEVGIAHRSMQKEITAKPGR